MGNGTKIYDGNSNGGINMYAYVDSVGKPPFDTNLYTYALNNPIRYTDPLGLQAGVLAAGWGIALGEPTPVGEILMAAITTGVLIYELCSEKSNYGCELQYENDLKICRSLSDPGARSRCYASAMERKNACDLEKPLPPLVTW